MGDLLERRCIRRCLSCLKLVLEASAIARVELLEVTDAGPHATTRSRKAVAAGFRARDGRSCEIVEGVVALGDVGCARRRRLEEGSVQPKRIEDAGLEKLGRRQAADLFGDISSKMVLEIAVGELPSKRKEAPLGVDVHYPILAPDEDVVLGVNDQIVSPGRGPVTE